jgi:hypothetical protein
MRLSFNADAELCSVFALRGHDPDQSTAVGQERHGIPEGVAVWLATVSCTKALDLATTVVCD